MTFNPVKLGELLSRPIAPVDYTSEELQRMLNAGVPASVVDKLRDRVGIPPELYNAAARGWRLHPLKPHSKMPWLKNWQHLASDDPQQFDSWLREYPQCNLAVVCGSASGVWVLDVDGEQGDAAIRELRLQHGGDWLQTLTCITGRGRHLYYAWPPGHEIRNSAGKLAQGLDVRGDNGYALIPPSTNESGHTYQWVDATTPIGEAPPWLLDMVDSPSPQCQSKADTAVITEGQRNATLASLAGTMHRRMMTPESIVTALLTENSSRCRPPLPESEMRAIATSIMQYAPGDGQANAPQLAAAMTQEAILSPPVDLEQMVDDVERYIRRFVILSDNAYLPVALWTIATHIVQEVKVAVPYEEQVFDCFPYLAVLSPIKQCGKTRLLEVLEPLVRNPWRGTSPSGAALYRMMDKCPALLLDEVEALSGSNKSEPAQAILAILNAGHRKGATIPRCFGQEHELRYFRVYGPKAFAAIGKLPDTLSDRSIIVKMQRRAQYQHVERFLAARSTAQAKPIHNALASFAREYREAVTQAYVHLIDNDLDFLSDRDADLWLPLFALCTVAAPNRVYELRESAKVLSKAKASDDADDLLVIKLLTDIRDLWPEGCAKWDSATLVEKLKALEDSPWKERELTQRDLATLLRPYNVEPKQIRMGLLTLKGYEYGTLKTAFSSYLEILNETRETTQ
jgi:Bifunctional DNA primase/polymerase, N-terminal/Protein of unknown function (DUF3631)/Primase C terminal 1 (PriCT-1)